MPEQFYKEALKLGQKEKRHLVSRGQYPYLSVLDDMMSKERLNTGKYIGVMQIPAEFIVGTKTEGRTNAFAANFMPLLEDGTEFAYKWKALCNAHLEEGIREPIKVYEYMNRFYVEEGNKRVSVLKFFGAVSIPAQVTRILPPKGEEKELKLYYEFLDFYNCTKINYIEFSKCGSYLKLQKLLGKGSQEVWKDDEVDAFRANYYYFEPKDLKDKFGLDNFDNYIIINFYTGNIIAKDPVKDVNTGKMVYRQYDAVIGNKLDVVPIINEETEVEEVDSKMFEL